MRDLCGSEALYENRATGRHAGFPSCAIAPQPDASSDGGAVLLKAVDDRLRLTARVAACLPDGRALSRVTHTKAALVSQRVFGLACGYADANDADRLTADPIQKLLLGRHPITGAALASPADAVSPDHHTAPSFHA